MEVVFAKLAVPMSEATSTCRPAGLDACRGQYRIGQRTQRPAPRHREGQALRNLRNLDSANRGFSRLDDRVRNPMTFGLMSTCHMTHIALPLGEPIYHIDHYAEGASFSERTGRISIARPSGVSAIRSPARHWRERRSCRAAARCPPRRAERSSPP